MVETADRLFYAEGLRAVGVERIVAEASVTRVTFYRHFASKDELIHEYLSGRANRARDRIEAAAESEPGNSRAVLDAIAQTLVEDGAILGFRGCEFVNAAAEYPDVAHPARAVAAGQRAWLVDLAAEALAALGHPRPRRFAEALLMLRTGAAVAADLDHSDDAGEVFLESWHAFVDASIPDIGEGARSSRGTHAS
ncbi:TetR/AcrR family transcriptional regulator [Amycolatopsis sp. CA-161197]|uniref:TetR/AcrR family transcriptional regulator n=1 Tax=Amycolatopsis sp. CA-161197 TaxID=3239922 RepID=UPI003D8E6D72